MAADLPDWLLRGLDRALEGRGRADLAARSAKLSATYRGGGGSALAVRGEADALAYAVARMPATFAAANRVLADLADLAPAFRPRTALDAGSGPGTAGYAAAALWPDLGELTQLDRSAAFLDFARQLFEGDEAAPAIRLHQREAGLDGLGEAADRFDLVLLAYVLAEFPAEAAGALAQRLWERCAGAFCAVEPGTPEGTRRILAARASLIAAGAHILAPCPHAAPCPLAPPDWCHFATRLPRRRAHMAAKNAALPFEDEKFAYVVAVRPPFAPPAADWSRVLAPPHASKAGIDLRLCRPDGTAAAEMVLRRDSARFPAARRLCWGDRLETPDPPGDTKL